MNNWPNRIRSFARQTLDEWNDIGLALDDIFRWIERGLRRDFAMFARNFRALFAKKDPARFAQTPPAGWHKATPEADVPPRKTKAVEVDFDVYTLAEIEAMTDDEYRIKVGSLGIGTRAEMIKLLTKKERKKPERGNAIEL